MIGETSELVERRVQKCCSDYCDSDSENSEKLHCWVGHGIATACFGYSADGTGGWSGKVDRDSEALGAMG